MNNSENDANYASSTCNSTPTVDTRIECKYGRNCYQRNAEHHARYKHTLTNKRKMDTVTAKQTTTPLKLARSTRNQIHSVRTSLTDVAENSQMDSTAVSEANSSRDNFSNQDSTTSTHIHGDVHGDEQITDGSSSSNTVAIVSTNTAIDESNNTPGSESHSTSTSDSSITASSESNTTTASESNETTASDSSNTTVRKTSITTATDRKQFIKDNFLVDMPADFYLFWQFCCDINPNEPVNAFQCVDLELVGAFDVLAGRFDQVNHVLSPSDFLCHWRYYHDPPEVQTVLRSIGNNQFSKNYHIGYFRDSPEALPSLMVSNGFINGGVFTKMGDNIFAATCLYLKKFIAHCDPFKKRKASKLYDQLNATAQKFNYSLLKITDNIKKRKIVATTFNTIGLVVPIDKRTKTGYRELAMSDKELLRLFDKIHESRSNNTLKRQYLSDLQPVFGYANLAIDECDFGTGIELGWNIIAHRTVGEYLDATALGFLKQSYELINKPEFGAIAEAHLSNRSKQTNLSIIHN